MSTSDNCPNSAATPALGVSVARVFAAVVAMAAIWFGCRFIVPRYEAHLMDLGARPSATVGALLIISSYVARYFWWVAPILVLVFVLSARTTSREKCPVDA
jgi:type II secretory pathway component PulF